MRKKTVFYAWFVGMLCTLFSSISFAQDAVYSQFYAVPMRLNPAFTGSSFAPRFGGAFRNQWPNLGNAYTTYTAYYEQSIERYNSGIGISLENDNAGGGILKSTVISLLYSYKLPINKKFDIKIGVDAGMNQKALQWDLLVFPDQIDAILGNNGPSGEVRPDVLTRRAFDISAGLLLTGEKVWLGTALHHLTSPSQSFQLINENLFKGLPMRFVLHGGTEIVLTKGNKHKPGAFISPNFLFTSQGPFQQFNLGSYVGVGAIFGGLWYRHTFGNADAGIFVMGFRQGVFKLGLSYDFTVSELANVSGGAIEVTLGVALDQDEVLSKKHKRSMINNCLKMFY